VTVRSVIPSVSRITHDRGNGRRPNMVSKGCTVTFFTSTNITQIRLSTMYFDSTGGATALLSNYAAAVSNTMQEPWRSLNSLSVSFLRWHVHDLMYIGDIRLHVLCVSV